MTPPAGAHLNLCPVPELPLPPDQTGRLPVWYRDRRRRLLVLGSDSADSSCMCQTPPRKSWRRWWEAAPYLWRSPSPAKHQVRKCLFNEDGMEPRQPDCLPAAALLVHADITYPFFWKCSHDALPYPRVVFLSLDSHLWKVKGYEVKMTAICKKVHCGMSIMLPLQYPEGSQQQIRFPLSVKKKKRASGTI